MLMHALPSLCSPKSSCVSASSMCLHRVHVCVGAFDVPDLLSYAQCAIAAGEMHVPVTVSRVLLH